MFCEFNIWDANCARTTASIFNWRSLWSPRFSRGRISTSLCHINVHEWYEIPPKMIQGIVDCSFSIFSSRQLDMDINRWVIRGAKVICVNCGNFRFDGAAWVRSIRSHKALSPWEDKPANKRETGKGTGWRPHDLSRPWFVYWLYNATSRYIISPVTWFVLHHSLCRISMVVADGQWPLSLRMLTRDYLNAH